MAIISMSAEKSNYGCNNARPRMIICEVLASGDDASPKSDHTS